MKRRYRPVEKTVAKLRALAEQGCTYKEAAARLKITVGAVGNHARNYSIPLVRGSQGPRTSKASKVTERSQQMAALYRSGRTLAEIGLQYSITRERVRQILRSCHGITASDGGQRTIVAEREQKRAARKNAKSLLKWGCGYAQYLMLRRMQKPTRAFCQQRKNAEQRGISWQLNLWQWWSIWEQSGHWSERGRGQGYCMSRIGDEGPYSVSNVFIATSRENSSVQKRKKSGLPMGVVKARRSKGYIAMRCFSGQTIRLGTFPTPELAHAAYLTASPPAEQVAA